MLPDGGIGQRFLAPDAAGTQHLEGLPGDHGGQPAGEVLHIGGVGSV
jgi:hypothetical protein